MNALSKFIKEKRNLAQLTQQALALKAGVGLRFIRDLEQGKTNLQMDKVNQVLSLFGHEMAPVKKAAKEPSASEPDRK
jgi:y4mF family transcriptional regulator